MHEAVKPPGLGVQNIEVGPALARMGDRAFVIHGTSMEPWFVDGDWVGIRAVPLAAEGQLVIALADGELTYKRFDRVGGQMILSPLNSSHTPLIPNEMKIVGVYKWMIRASKDGRV